MNIGTAIFASVVLVLFVYHKKFRIVVSWIVGVGAVVVGLFFLVVYVSERYRKAVNERTAVQSCITRLNTTGVAPTGFASIKDACEQYTEWKPQINDHGMIYDKDVYDWTVVSQTPKSKAQ